MKRKIFAVGLIFLIVLAVQSLALTADEYFNRAAKKYVMENLPGAELDLQEALKLDPGHEKARDLLNEIEREIGKTKSAAPTTTTLPAPVIRYAPTTSRPVVRERPKTQSQLARELLQTGKKLFERGKYSGARDYFLQVYEIFPGHEEAVMYLEEIKKKTASIKEPSVVVPPVVRAQKKGLDPQVLVYAPLSIIIASLVIFIFALLLRRIVLWWRAKYSYCNECGTRNKLDVEFCRKCGNRLMIAELTKEQQAWFGKYSWTKNPFTLEIIPDTFAGHQVELTMILDKLKAKSGHILIIGGLGTGKTTLMRLLERNLTGKFNPIYLIRPPQHYDELIDLVVATITNKTSKTHKYSLYEFQNICAKYKGIIVLLLDEAHEFSEGFEKFLRTLGDLRNVLLIMAGLPQTREKLKRELPALFDRITEHVLLGSLTNPETRELIEKRIINAGGTGLGPFTTQAIDKVFNLSYGIPREVLKICDWTVTQAVRSNRSMIDASNVEEYGKEIEYAKFENATKENLGSEIKENNNEQ